MQNGRKDCVTQSNKKKIFFGLIQVHRLDNVRFCTIIVKNRLVTCCLDICICIPKLCNKIKTVVIVSHLQVGKKTHNT